MGRRWCDGKEVVCGGIKKGEREGREYNTNVANQGTGDSPSTVRIVRDRLSHYMCRSYRYIVICKHCEPIREQDLKSLQFDWMVVHMYQATLHTAIEMLSGKPG